MEALNNRETHIQPRDGSESIANITVQMLTDPQLQSELTWKATDYDLVPTNRVVTSMGHTSMPNGYGKISSANVTMPTENSTTFPMHLTATTLSIAPMTQYASVLVGQTTLLRESATQCSPTVHETAHMSIEQMVNPTGCFTAPARSFTVLNDAFTTVSGAPKDAASLTGPVEFFTDPKGAFTVSAVGFTTPCLPLPAITTQTESLTHPLTHTSSTSCLLQTPTRLITSCGGYETVKSMIKSDNVITSSTNSLVSLNQSAPTMTAPVNSPTSTSQTTTMMAENSICSNLSLSDSTMPPQTLTELPIAIPPPASFKSPSSPTLQDSDLPVQGQPMTELPSTILENMDTGRRRPTRIAAQKALVATKRLLESSQFNVEGPEAPNIKKIRRSKRVSFKSNDQNNSDGKRDVTNDTASCSVVHNTIGVTADIHTGDYEMGPSQNILVEHAPSTRPPPLGLPRVWSEARGALCEALPYFKAYQGSLYSKGKVANGFLIDKEVDHGDVFASQVIISSVGGGRERDEATGQMVRTKDASDDATNVQAFKLAMEAGSLVAVIAGDNHPLYPCQPPHVYSVLGYFHITDMWKENQIPRGSEKEVKIWRVRLEKADLNEPSWWAQETGPSDISLRPRAPVRRCRACGSEWKEIFTIGWFCRTETCEKYYKLPNGQPVRLQELTYTQIFLEERTPFTGKVPSIVPEMPSFEGCHGTELALRQGFVCPLCGCCNRRLYWNRLVCQNNACSFNMDAPMLPFPQAIWDAENKKFDQQMMRRRGEKLAWCPSVVTIAPPPEYLDHTTLHTQVIELRSYTIHQFFLQDAGNQVIGSFSLLSSKGETNAMPDGPDDLFRTLEKIDIGLRRNPAALVGHKLEGYTRHFQQNFGARYKFGVTVQSKGFDEAPDVILKALHRLIWAKTVTVKASNAFLEKLDPEAIGPKAHLPKANDFNELLALGYMEGDKIRYHDDGESELGPVVAALSLGSPCTMKFRPKKSQPFKWLKRRGKHGDEVWQDFLEVTMKHGDIMVMIGEDIQKVYEHTVEPHGVRRFSLTARYIDPGRMTSEEDKREAAINGAIPEHANAFVYDGGDVEI